MNDGTSGYGRLAYGAGPYGDDPEFEIAIVGTNSPVEAGEAVVVEVEVTNMGGEGAQNIDLEVLDPNA